MLSISVTLSISIFSLLIYFYVSAIVLNFLSVNYIISSGCFTLSIFFYQRNLAFFLPVLAKSCCFRFATISFLEKKWKKLSIFKSKCILKNVGQWITKRGHTQNTQNLIQSITEAYNNTYETVSSVSHFIRNVAINCRT